MARPRKKTRIRRSDRAAWRLIPAGAAPDATAEFPGPFAGVSLDERMAGLKEPVQACPDGGPDHPSWAW